ncbi:uncharacterized protein N7511_005723 [Penicillium nucicola]|uniref:uncharacterized protein n=1 Tax=Penicillium nucicola TaxID=1850975 RepID=UPI00254516B4|nr:uncharacterized protein N7511_005723 [Penicillium nucicola]KAJ5762341.1 hypothetical protein N7511_005723 [Penicillium nucicola]
MCPYQIPLVLICIEEHEDFSSLINRPRTKTTKSKGSGDVISGNVTKLTYKTKTLITKSKSIQALLCAFLSGEHTEEIHARIGSNLTDLEANVREVILAMKEVSVTLTTEKIAAKVARPEGSQFGSGTKKNTDDETDMKPRKKAKKTKFDRNPEERTRLRGSGGYETRSGPEKRDPRVNLKERQIIRSSQ